MEPKALADSLVEAGIGRLVRHGDDTSRYVIPGTKHTVYAGTFITDWRVAGKCLEKCWVDVCHNTPEFLDFVNDRINGKSIHELPRAIIEACVIALREDDYG